MPLTVHCFHHLPLKNRRFRAGGILVCRNFCDSLLSNLLKSTNRSLTNTGRRLNASASAPVCFLWTWPIHSAEVGAWWYGPGRVQKGDNIYRRHRQCLNAGWQDDFRLLKLGRRWIFQHKKDPQSSARITQEFLKKENVKKNKTQKTITWPSISPAFSQIKNLWGVSEKGKVRQHILSIKDEQEEKKSLRRMAEHFFRNLRNSSIKNKGGHKKCWKKTASDLSSFCGPRLFTAVNLKRWF